MAIFATLDFIAKLPGGGEVAFDYSNPAASVADDAMREAHQALAAKVAAAGEALQTHFVTSALHERLGALGFRRIEDLGPNEIRARFFPRHAAPSRANGGHVVLAATL